MTRPTLYTVSQNKTPTQSFSGNFGKYEPIVIILSLLHYTMNCKRRYYIILHLTSNPLPHYLAKFECSTAQLYTVIIHSKVCLLLLLLLVFCCSQQVNDSHHLAGGSWRRRTAGTAVRHLRSSHRWESCLGKIAEVVSRCLPRGFYFRVSFSWIVLS